jgi:hypothetical protein
LSLKFRPAMVQRLNEIGTFDFFFQASRFIRLASSMDGGVFVVTEEKRYTVACQAICEAEFAKTLGGRVRVFSGSCLDI